MKRIPLNLLPLLLALMLSAAEAAGAPHPSLPPPVIPDCLGVNIHFTDPKPGELEMLAAAGFKWVRMDFSWGGTERKKGEYDFSAYDRLAAALEQHGIRAVFILDYGNPLYDGELPPTSEQARAAFGRWAVEGVRHFAGRGYLWEMWNEPNGGFWKPKADVKQYAALARATGEALRDAGLLGPKGEAFIGPATSTIDFPFLEVCFQAGLLEFWDAVSVHPYRQQAPETVAEEYRNLRLLIQKYAPQDKTVPIISGSGVTRMHGSTSRPSSRRNIYHANSSRISRTMWPFPSGTIGTTTGRIRKNPSTISGSWRTNTTPVAIPSTTPSPPTTP